MSLHFPSSFAPGLRLTKPFGRRRNPAAIRASQGLLNRLAALADAVAMVALALVFQQLGAGADAWLSPCQAIVAGVVSAATLLAILVPSGSYRPERRRRASTALFDILVGVACAALACRLLVWAFAPEVLHAGTWLLIWTIAAIGTLGAMRAIAVLLEGPATGARWLQRRVAVVGEASAGHRLADALASDPRFRALGFFSGETIEGGDLQALRRLAEDEGVDLIVLAAPTYDTQRLLALAGEVQWISADVVALVEDAEALRGSRMRSEVAGRPVLVLHRHPLKGAEAVLKLVEDYAVAITALLLAGPAMLVVALALRIAGGGPVLFRQRRLGFNGRPFTIYKFRTLRVDPSDDGSRGVVAGDPRCTRLGSLLRKTSLDELPQLFNVLRGEMSIVGPRPHVPNMQVGPGAYAEVVQAYAARHQIKPGLTGWAQINGMRGGIDTLDRARQGVELDLFYIRNWSLWLDLRIILATAFRHLAGPSVF